jgi:hypothetical protein
MRIRLARDEADITHELGYLDYIYQCKGCLSCVQNCTKNILTRVVNPEYLRLGDSYYTPDIVLSTWFQSESGRIPVSGSGYGGPFSGPGFDSMWTDMSEIVRPTRDGIHGGTSVQCGHRPQTPYLTFADGQLLWSAARAGDPVACGLSGSPDPGAGIGVHRRGCAAANGTLAINKKRHFAKWPPNDIRGATAPDASRYRRIK